MSPGVSNGAACAQPLLEMMPTYSTVTNFWLCYLSTEKKVNNLKNKALGNSSNVNAKN